MKRRVLAGSGSGHGARRAKTFPLERSSMTRQLIACLAIVSIVTVALADSKVREPAARRAISEDKIDAAKAIAELRAMGPEGLRTFVEAKEAEIGLAMKAAGSMRDRVLSALDSICA